MDDDITQAVAKAAVVMLKANMDKCVSACAGVDTAHLWPGAMGEMRDALAWYGEQSRLARLIGSEGDAGRRAIDADGGKRARAILAKLGRTP